MRLSVTNSNALVMSKTVSQIIEDLGGPTAIAEATTISDGAVRQWKFKDRIPRRAWPDLIEAFPNVISLEVLRSVEARAA